MLQPSVIELPIRKLRHRLLERVFAVPKLQREFVWDGPRAADLLDSIYQHMPIGALLVWQTDKRNYDLLRQSLHILPPFHTGSRHGWFLIDGQQRLSVIHLAFEGGTHENSNGREVDFGRLCFILDPDEVDDDEPVFFAYRKPVHRKFVPVQHILAHDWRRRLKDHLVPELKRIERCRRKLLDYRLPVVMVHSDDLSEVREVFLRINSGGMKISAADRAFARASTVDLRDLAHELRAGLSRAFDNLDFNVILQGLAFVTPGRELDLGQRALESTIRHWERKIDGDGAESEFFSLWRRYRTAFGKAVDYLHANFCVLTPGFLPSDYMLATLAVFFFHHRAAPSTRQRREIRKWFWATGVGQRYSGRGYHQNLMADVRFFKRLAKGAARFSFADLADPADILRTEYGQNSSVASAFYCLLVLQDPCYIENGESICYGQSVSPPNRGDRHHIFPRALLAQYGFRHRDYNSLVNICLICHEENINFGMKRPNVYLEPYWHKRHFKRAMKSHLIPYKSDSGLRTVGVRRAYAQFRARRLQLICAAFEKEAGIRLFRRGK